MTFFNCDVYVGINKFENLTKYKIIPTDQLINCMVFIYKLVSLTTVVQTYYYRTELELN